VLDLAGSPVEMGRRHGTSQAEGIRKYLADRLALAADPYWAGSSTSPERVIELAESTVRHHHDYSPDLFDEMSAMAEAAAITVPEAVVVGGFTDLIDLVRAEGPAPVVDECTAVLDPVAGVYAQTWDMHASAGEFVIMLALQPDSGPAAFVQTTMGCLGQMGTNEAGIGVGINNLTSIGRPGVTWPFVVRKVLQQTDLDDAVKCVLDADLAGGHNFAVIGPEGHGVNIEAMPTTTKVTRVDSRPFAHANHCLDEETAMVEGHRERINVEDSRARQQIADLGGGDLDALFANPRISKRVDDPHLTGTCGAVVMRPRQRAIDAVWGIPGQGDWETFTF